jgi:hypothetical protein
MTEARRKTKIWLLQKDKTFADLAPMCRLAEATIHNVLDGYGSTKSKRAITNALGIQVWHDVPVTERYVTVRPGIAIEFTDVELVREWRNELPSGTAIQRGRTLTFTKACTLAIEIETPEATRKAQTPKGSRGEKGFSQR